MHLADKINHSVFEIDIELGDHTWWLPGPAAFAEELSQCLIRYILFEDVHETCGQLAERWCDLLNASNPKLRAPMEQAWIEWTDPECGEQVGVLVNAASDGRGGILRMFWTKEETVEVAQAEVVFDFDAPINFRQAKGRPLYGMRALPAAYGDLRRHLAIAIDSSWERYFRATALGPHGLPEVSSICGERLWPDVVRVLAFFILLASRTPFIERPVLRERLNVSRVNAGKQPLLDHVELRLGQPSSPNISGQEQTSGRKHPRLHMVRGHLVRRRDSVFWRAAHVRGGGSCESPMPATRLVRMG